MTNRTGAVQTTTPDYTYGGQSDADGTVIGRGSQRTNQLTTFVETPPSGTPLRQQLFYDWFGSLDCITTETWTVRRRGSIGEVSAS